MDDSPLDAATGQFPHVRLPGPLTCCLKSIEARGRLAEPGARIRRPECQAVLLVDAVGAWTLAAQSSGQAPSRLRVEVTDRSNVGAKALWSGEPHV
jgi:hypothetical protein